MSVQIMDSKKRKRSSRGSLNPHTKEFFPSSLNPRAKEFVPRSSIKVGRTLNPRAKEFIPTSRTLNPRAKEFIPTSLEMDNLRDTINRLRDEIKSVKIERDEYKSRQDKFFPPPSKIVNVDPSIEEFITIDNNIRWVWNSCIVCTTSDMCQPSDFDPSVNDIIEKGFSIFSRDKTQNIITYSISGGMKYELDFSTMFQKNLSTGTKRLVERTIDTTRTKNPKWVRVLNEIHQMRTYIDQFEDERTLVDLDKKSSEFSTIEHEFLNSTSGSDSTMKDEKFKITSIIKVVDPINARLYEVKKSSLKNKDEIMLFHGARDMDPLDIIEDGGLDLRIGNIGSYFGKGIYTSASPYYSHTNFGGRNVLLYTKVLLGDVKVFPNNHREKLYKAPEGFHSVCSNVESNGTTIYTVYDNHQIYISYLIYYSKNGSNDDNENDDDSPTVIQLD